MHLIPELLNTGRRVTCVGRSKIPRHDLPKEVNYVSGDFAQDEFIARLLDKHQEIIHLAYATVPNTSFENPLADLLQNLPPTVSLFSEVAKRNAKLVLVSSGGTVYGEVIHMPIEESHPTRPISPYGVTKLTLENYAYLYAATQGLKFVCVRPANAYGVGQKPSLGQGFISTAISSILNGKSVRIYGENGTIRDYLYVSDVASGIVSALERGSLSETYNLGSGIGRSNLDVIAALVPLMKEIGCNISLEKLDERPFDVKSNVLSSNKLHEHTEWAAKVDFASGLRRTLEWLRTYSG